MSEAPVAIVTGASSGIGRQAAVQLAARGYRVALVGRRQHELEATAQLAAGVAKGAEHRIYVADLGHSERTAALTTAIMADMGRVDVLVNNAGMAQLGPLADGIDEQALRAHVQLNTLSPAIMIATAWPQLVQRPGACIVNITTMSTVDPFPGLFSYALSKAPLNVMTKSCATEGAPNVRAFGVAPGCVETPMLRGLFDAQTVGTELTVSATDVATLVVECVAGQWDAHNGGVVAIEKQDGQVVRWWVGAPAE
ncbi:Dehydrogenase [Enhygromyxa salina]|uniref:Dehydrogenase n=1 Tax=Enhygromyxa salina TaxID=215803 RepID=A0A0C2CZG9_9BACT|nr:SDR family NAD(P)-dependent oxidoreductase [Enhygromyxa salina]KIG16371.1 Dehydrogenase [Enhygromyxa salina]